MVKFYNYRIINKTLLILRFNQKIKIIKIQINQFAFKKFLENKNGKKVIVNYK